MSQTRAVLFDLDDTLVSTSTIKWAHHKQVALDNWGIVLTDEVLATHWGKPFDEMISELYQHSASLDEMRAANQASTHRFRKTSNPGAPELVRELLDAGLLVGVITSTNTDLALGDLRRCGFEPDELLLVQGANTWPFHKPDPQVFTPALELLAARGIGPAEVIYVGDAPIDQQAARAAGLGFVAVPTGIYPAEVFGPDAVIIDAVAQLPSVL